MFWPRRLHGSILHWRIPISIKTRNKIFKERASVGAYRLRSHVFLKRVDWGRVLIQNQHPIYPSIF